MIKIISNNQPRRILYGFELPESTRNEFDYLNDEEYSDRAFFRYKGQYYDIGDAMRINPSDSFNCAPEMNQWHGYYGESFFSGVLIKIVDSDSIIVGRYYS